jgi:crossover junction endodeoxyribonuclease RuvC
VIENEGARLRFIDAGCIAGETDAPLGQRLAVLYAAVAEITKRFAPDEAAVEETFVNVNPASTLKLGQARGAVMLAPALAGIPVAEYSATQVKKSVTGTGHAAKEQVQAMIATLLPGFRATRGDFGADAADALAAAICHAHHRDTHARIFSPRRAPASNASRGKRARHAERASGTTARGPVGSS